MLNKTISDHLNELKILNYCLHWPFLAFSYAFGLGLKIENIPSTSFFAFFQFWPNRPRLFLLKIYLKLNQSQFCMVEKYKNKMKTAFKCQMQSLDYKNNTDRSKIIINDWVASCTNGKIKNLFSDMDPDTACVLVSCIYFKGDWYENFKSYKTRDASSIVPKKKFPLLK